MPYNSYGQDVAQVDTPSLGSSIAKGAASGASMGSVIPGWGTLIGGVLGAGYGLFAGEHQKALARKLMGQNQYPTEQPPQAIQQNATMANRLALQGLPSAQYETAMKNIQRQQQNAVVAAQDRRAGMESIADTNQATNDAYGNLASADAQARRQNIGTAMGANQVLGQYQQNAFDWNAKNRYLQNYQYAMSLMGQGNANVTQAVGGLLGSGVQASNSFGQAAMMRYLLGLGGDKGGSDITANATLPSKIYGAGSDLQTATPNF